MIDRNTIAPIATARTPAGPINTDACGWSDTSRTAYSANVIATAAIAPLSIMKSSAQPYRKATSG